MNRICIALFLLVLFLFTGTFLFSQCPSGEIGVSGAGCGCLSGCNLTSYGGPNCTGTTGNCSAGEIPMSVDISVPAGCTFTITATMANRGTACSASGADAGDQVKVDVVGGVKVFQTGSGNATLTDSYTLAGPGTVRISGTANRADEIITYSTTSTGCVNCASALGIELSEFTAVAEGRTVRLTWITASETNTDQFIIERSQNGVYFEAIGSMSAAGNSHSPVTYTHFDGSPPEGVSYYRIRQTDLDGKYTYTPIRSVVYSGYGQSLIIPNPADDIIYLPANADSRIVVSDPLGQTVLVSPPVQQLSVSDFPSGIYLVSFETGGKTVMERIVVQHK